MMSLSRRGFLKGAALSASSILFGGCVTEEGYLKYPSVAKVAPHLLGAKDKLRIAVVGVGGKGWSDWTPMFDHGEEIVALCDVDRGPVDRGLKYIQEKGKDPSKVATFSDYRKMLEKVKNIDAVVVATPDHIHGPAAISAMKLGYNVYVQKPLVRTIWEAHYFEKVAREVGVVTQMGNQGSAGSGLRRNVEVLQAGVLGNVTEVHVWTNRPIWPQGIARPEGSDPVPAELDWDSWLGTAPFRPYKKDVYHTFKWRGFFDFGTGAFGDMACHTMNLPFRGLRLGAVDRAECKMIEGKNLETYPSKSIVKLHYVARGSLPAVDLYWYDGNEKPKAEIMPQVIATLGEVPKTGCLIIGDKGVMCSTNDYGQQAYIALKGEEKMKAVQKHDACAESVIPVTLPRAADENQDIEFVDACKGLVKAYSGADHSVPILESMLVGCIAQRVPGVLNWDAKLQKFDNDLANQYLRPYIRTGWEF